MAEAEYFWESDIDGLLVDFGEPVTWTGIHGPTQVTAIFDAEYLAEEFDQTVAQSASPLVTSKESYFPGIKAGDTITHRETTFKVISVEPDGTGEIRIRLSKDQYAG